MPSNPVHIPAGFAEVTIINQQLGGSGECDVVFGIASHNGDETDLDECLHSWSTYVLTGMCAGTVTLLGGRIIFGPRPGGPTFDGGPRAGDPTTGDQGAASLPPNNAVLIGKRTAIGGRQFRGRLYIPGVPSPAVTSGGSLLSASQAQIQAKATAMLAHMATFNVPMYLLHRDRLDPVTHDPIPGSAPVPTLVSNLDVKLKIATQRTRLRD